MSRVVNVCVFTRSWRNSGSGLFAQELAAGLADIGVATLLIAPPTLNPKVEEPRANLRRLRQIRELTSDSGRMARISVSLVRMIGSALCLLRARFRCRTFIVTIPEPLPFTLLMLAMLRLSGGRIIFIAHDPLPHTWALPRQLQRLERWGHELSYRFSTQVVVLSEPSRAAMHRHYPALETPVSVIEHGVFPMEELTALPGTGTLLVFGTLRQNKGVAEAIAGAIAAHDAGVPVRLIVAGALDNKDRDYGKACAALARPRPDVVEMLIGYIDDDRLVALFARCDALLMPYGAFDSQSGVALLAASNARPIIATSAGGIGALIAEGMPAVTIDCPAGEHEVAGAICAFFETPSDIWRERAEAYRATIMKRRSWSAIATAYCELTETLSAE